MKVSSNTGFGQSTLSSAKGCPALYAFASALSPQSIKSLTSAPGATDLEITAAIGTITAGLIIAINGNGST
jgi:hypothetical protein